MKPRRIALCGAPNVGKSSLMNALLGEERVLVDSEAGQPEMLSRLRSAITASLMLVDTAGSERHKMSRSP